jgi:hypothetical protein
VDFWVSNNWIQLDRMHITEQKADRISFSARSGGVSNAIPLGWSLDLRESHRETFSGRLTGDAFDSRFVELQFVRWKGEPDGPANGSQPIRSDTNRTSSAAGFRR